MKNITFLTAMIIMSFSSFSNPVQVSDIKSQIYKKISDEEGDSSDSKKAMDLILSMKKNTNAELDKLADFYVATLDSLGGRSYSRLAIKTLKRSKKLLNDGYSLKDLTTAVKIIGDVSNDSDNDYLVFKKLSKLAMKTDTKMIDLAETFKKVYVALGNAYYYTRLSLKAIKIMSEYDNWTFDEMANSLVSLDAVDSAEDAVGNLKLVLKIATKHNNLEKMTNEFNSILDSNGGGSYYTKISRKAFKNMYK